MHKRITILLLGWILGGSTGCELDPDGSSGSGSGSSSSSAAGSAPDPNALVRASRDLISLHYDHAPDRDDGQSAAADRTLLQSVYSKKWINSHVVAVSGAYGRNAGSFNRGSDAVMNAVWNDSIGWIAAHGNREGAVAALTDRWAKTLRNGGDVWVKEGGQSDVTAAVIQQIKARLPKVDTRSRIHVVQHGQWNENQTTPSALAYVRAESNYIRIANANSYLKGSRDETFVQTATSHPQFGPYWQAAFSYYPSIIDFSDTGEVMHMLGLGQVGIDEFRSRYLD